MLYLRNLTLTLALRFCLMQYLLMIAFLVVLLCGCFLLSKSTTKVPFPKIYSALEVPFNFHLNHFLTLCPREYDSFFLYGSRMLTVSIEQFRQISSCLQLHPPFLLQLNSNEGPVHSSTKDVSWPPLC